MLSSFEDGVLSKRCEAEKHNQTLCSLSNARCCFASHYFNQETIGDVVVNVLMMKMVLVWAAVY